MAKLEREGLEALTSPSEPQVSPGVPATRLKGVGRAMTEQACPYCGQFVAIHIDEDTLPEEREALAKAKCGCPQAVRERDLKEAFDKLEAVCGREAMDNGFEYPLDDDALEVCRRAIEWIYDALIRDMTVRSMQGDRIVVKSDGRDVKIKRTCQKQMQL